MGRRCYPCPPPRPPAAGTPPPSPPHGARAGAAGVALGQPLWRLAAGVRPGPGGRSEPGRAPLVPAARVPRCVPALPGAAGCRFPWLSGGGKVGEGSRRASLQPAGALPGSRGAALPAVRLLGPRVAAPVLRVGETSASPGTALKGRCGL